MTRRDDRPNGETDMNDIDIERGRRLLSEAIADKTQTWGFTQAHSLWYQWANNNAAAMFDAIENGRQWETIAIKWRELARQYVGAACMSDRIAGAAWMDVLETAMAVAADEMDALLADRTPTPTDGA